MRRDLYAEQQSVARIAAKNDLANALSSCTRTAVGRCRGLVLIA
jgi:hypothetical protein